MYTYYSGCLSFSQRVSTSTGEHLPKKTSRILRNSLAVVGVGAIALHGSRLFLKLFGSNLPYGMPKPPNDPLDSEEFVRFLSVTTDATSHRDVQIEVLRNGEVFYEQELDAIRKAKSNVNLLFYEFLQGSVADRFLDALIERARAGVRAKLIVDAIGSHSTSDSYFQGLRAAGGRAEWFHAFGWGTWTHMDNRTHRKLITVDGELGFIGGAGIADHWLTGSADRDPWRDTMLRVRGSAVAGLVSVFSENWVECSGEILSGAEQFPAPDKPGASTCLVINSTPHGGSTKARILFQGLIDSARKEIQLTTPYFLPDRSARNALIRAVRKRNVKVQIITAGSKGDHPTLSKLSRAMTLGLIKAGIQIFEYQPGMIHAKLMTIDGVWTVGGSTNFDHRSFALNDEVNVAVMDRELAATIGQDFTGDRAKSKLRTVKRLEEKAVSVRIIAFLARLVRREA